MSIKIDFEKTVKQIRPKINNYLESVKDKINAKSFIKIKGAFSSKRTAKGLEYTYNAIQDLLDKPKKINYKHLEEKYKEHTQIRKDKVKEKAANKINKGIKKAFDNSVFVNSKVVNDSKSFKAITVNTTVKGTGKKIMLPDNLLNILRKLYLRAMTHIDNSCKYKMQSTFMLYTSDDSEEEEKVATYFVVGSKFDLEPNGAKKLILKWLHDSYDKIKKYVQDYYFVKLEVDFKFIKLVSGAGTKATESRDRESIYNKHSVLTIKNDDQSCFWHCLAVHLSKDHKKYKEIKIGRNIRTEIAKELCSKCNMTWDEPVSIDEFPDVEEHLKCNIYVLDVENLPMLRTTLNIYDVLVYKSEYNADLPQCWLMLDDNHYNVINNPNPCTLR